MITKQLGQPHVARIVLAVIALVLAGVAAGCGGSERETRGLSADRLEAFASPYCVTARRWAARDLDSAGEDVSARPATFSAYWREYLRYRHASLSQSPPNLRDENALVNSFLLERVTPVPEKYGFDVQRIDASGTPAEKQQLDEMPPATQRAQSATDAFDNKVCGYGGSPPAANVTFEKTAASGLYCDAVARQEEGNAKVASSGFAPASFRAWVESGRLAKVLDDLDASAPHEIADEVRADNAWVREHKLVLLKKYEYDYRRLLLEGSAEELAAFAYFDPAIERQDSLVSAYVQQVCGVQ